MKAKKSQRKSNLATKAKGQNPTVGKSTRREFLQQAGYRCVGFAGLWFSANLTRRADACSPPPPCCNPCNLGNCKIQENICWTNFTCNSNICNQINTCNASDPPYFTCNGGAEHPNNCIQRNSCLTLFTCNTAHHCPLSNMCQPNYFTCNPEEGNICDNQDNEY